MLTRLFCTYCRHLVLLINIETTSIVREDHHLLSGREIYCYEVDKDFDIFNAKVVINKS